MKLETHEGMIAGPVTADVIARTVAQLTEVGKAYVILNDGQEQDLSRPLFAVGTRRGAARRAGDSEELIARARRWLLGHALDASAVEGTECGDRSRFCPRDLSPLTSTRFRATRGSS
jgi:hypothetical protein